jgi:hypothetical protein
LAVAVVLRDVVTKAAVAVVVAVVAVSVVVVPVVVVAVVIIALTVGLVSILLGFVVLALGVQDVAGLLGDKDTAVVVHESVGCSGVGVSHGLAVAVAVANVAAGLRLSLVNAAITASLVIIAIGVIDILALTVGLVGILLGLEVLGLGVQDVFGLLGDEDTAVVVDESVGGSGVGVSQGVAVAVAVATVEAGLCLSLVNAAITASLVIIAIGVIDILAITVGLVGILLGLEVHGLGAQDVAGLLVDEDTAVVVH